MAFIAPLVEAAVEGIAALTEAGAATVGAEATAEVAAETTAAGTAEEAISAGETAAAGDTVASGADSVSARITTSGCTVGAQGTPAKILAGGAAASGTIAATGYAVGQVKKDEK